jgi:hypothetical protein
MGRVRAGIGRQATAVLAIYVMTFGGPSQAAGPSPKPDAASESPTVSELVVTASKEVSELLVTAKIGCDMVDHKITPRVPKIVSIFPTKGVVVQPGLLVVRITFDQDMLCSGNFSRLSPFKNPCPFDPPIMFLGYDKRTIRTVCYVEPDTHYGALMTEGRFRPFTGRNGVVLGRHDFDFKTSGGPPVTTACDALLEDPFTAHEIKDQGKKFCGPPPGD